MFLVIYPFGQDKFESFSEFLRTLKLFSMKIYKFYFKPNRIGYRFIKEGKWWFEFRHETPICVEID